MKTTTGGLIALLLLAAAPVTGQNLPGYEGDYDSAAAQFRSYALGNFQEVLGDWVEAVNHDRLEDALHLYTRDAYVQLGLGGRVPARQAVAELMQQAEFVQVGLGDFDASGTISYGSLRLVLESAQPGGDRDGTMLLVLRRQGRDWLIRSQTLVLD